MQEFLKRELKIGRDSGTYLFYGKDRDDLLREILDFSKALNCRETEEFCGVCEVCKRIDRLTYGDLYILDGIKGIRIEEIRETIENAVASSYEGGKKIFILRDVERLRKESANALLKIIEEPPRDTFFFLTTGSLNILSTIKSRSILVYGSKRTEDSRENNFLYDLVDDFLERREYLDELDRLKVVEEIIRHSERDREIYRDIIRRVLYHLKKEEKLEDYLHLKDYLRFPVNDKGILQSLFLKI